jgi:endonuclease/exonuclease/phosphatase (EEP) superfamily protein YafD
VLGLLLIAALRILTHDATLLLVCINAFTLYFYLPAYVVLAFALVRRMWWLAAASLLVIGCHLAWIAPDFRSAVVSPGPVDAKSTASLRVFYVNANRYNQSRDELLAEVAAAHPDVVVFAEFWIPWRPTMLKSPVMAAFPYGTDLQSWTRGDVIVRSRVPIEDLQAHWAGGRVFIEFNVTFDGRPLHFLGLHSPRPMNMESHDYRGYWKDVLPAIAKRPRPLVVLGDFNSTQHSRIYEQVTALGLRSVHELLGRGFVTTWPNGKLWMPPIRIDHVFISPEVECVRCVEGVGAGSDHRPLILDLRWKPATAA